MKLIMHETGCKGPAFYSLKQLAFNVVPSPHIGDIQTLDGGKPKVGQVLRCGTCGEIWSQREESVIKVLAD